MAQNRDQRLSAGELKRALTDAGAPWSLDDELDDEARPPEFPLGGELPPDAPPVDEVERTNFRTLLSENPPADPDLARICIEAGLLDREVALSAERPPADQRSRYRDRTTPDSEGSPSGQPLTADDIAPPQFGPRSDRVEPK